MKRSIYYKAFSCCRYPRSQNEKAKNVWLHFTSITNEGKNFKLMNSTGAYVCDLSLFLSMTSDKIGNVRHTQGNWFQYPIKCLRNSKYILIFCPFIISSCLYKWKFMRISLTITITRKHKKKNISNYLKT